MKAKPESPYQLSFFSPVDKDMRKALNSMKIQGFFQFFVENRGVEPLTFRLPV
jgi:hypothetical protein